MVPILTKSVLPNDPQLQYMGRIDDIDPLAPVFVYPCTSVSMRFRGTYLSVKLTNIHSYYENSVGVILDGAERKIILPESGETEILLGEDLADCAHEVLLFKRMDACHYVKFQGFCLNEHAQVLELPQSFGRRMEFYGDSVTAGEISEAEDYRGKVDPVHNGQYSNSFYSYAWYTARFLNAQIHDIAQGGIALLPGTGYFCAPTLLGMEEVYDKIQCNPYLGELKPWDFTRYMPHVVVVAIGQNDNHPEDIMEPGIDTPKAMHWRQHYIAFVRGLREHYPNAVIILSTTILNHGKNWDLAIDAVCRELNDPQVHHFLYSNNGCGTPGHIRGSEAKKMAEELSGFITGLGEGIWEDAV